MTINLSEIYARLKAWRDERRITAESQKQGYMINVMEEFGELAQAVRENDEHAIIDALCDIAVFTINAGAEIPCEKKRIEIDTSISNAQYFDFSDLIEVCGDFARYNYMLFSRFRSDDFNHALFVCAVLCEKHGFNFEIAMLETIKEINSRTGSYDESIKKWVKDTSEQAKAKWYKADYNKAKLEK